MTAQVSGVVAIVGRPNVGKSTLLNRILGQKISITSRKPQTTRQRVLGIRVEGAAEMIFVDTPGWQRHPKKHLNRLMNQQVVGALAGTDAVVMVADARGWTGDDELVATAIAQYDCPRILALNKHDRVAPKTRLLVTLADLGAKPAFSDLIPICARTGDNVPQLLKCVAGKLPARAHAFPPDQVTTQSRSFLAGELIREQLMRGLGDELPYSVSVAIDEFVEDGPVTRIDATIWVERKGQKAIVIGRHGEQIKLIASAARQDIEKMIQTRVYLRTWVKIKENWTDDLRALQALGFGG